VGFALTFTKKINIVADFFKENNPKLMGKTKDDIRKKYSPNFNWDGQPIK
jgi:hypothetical protein